MTTTRTIAEIRHCTLCGSPYIYTGNDNICRKCADPNS